MAESMLGVSRRAPGWVFFFWPGSASREAVIRRSWRMRPLGGCRPFFSTRWVWLPPGYDKDARRPRRDASARVSPLSTVGTVTARPQAGTKSQAAAIFVSKNGFARSSTGWGSQQRARLDAGSSTGLPRASANGGILGRPNLGKERTTDTEEGGIWGGRRLCRRPFLERHGSRKYLVVNVSSRKTPPRVLRDLQQQHRCRSLLQQSLMECAGKRNRLPLGCRSWSKIAPRP